MEAKDPSKRWLAVTTANKSYVGHCAGQSEELRLGQPIDLTDVWEHVNELQPTERGIGRLSLLLPPNGLKPMKVITVVPASWYDIDENEMAEHFKELIKKAEEPLMRAGAREAGLHLPGGSNRGMPPPHPGRK